jgi:AP2-like factor, ANT lineage
LVVDMRHARVRAGDLEEQERGAAAELAAIAGAAPPPKLEDFLGGAKNGGGCVVSGGAETAAAAEMYDSELKFIAAGFLTGAAAGAAPSLERADAKQLDYLPAAAAPAPEQRKAVESFGQRTSIYRGVTR